MKRLVLVGMVCGAALMATGALAQQAPAGAPPAPNYAAVQIKATDLGHRTWMLEGTGGNMTVVAGDDGVILIDTEFLPLHDKIKAAVAGLSDKPIKYVINTHAHGDHTGGNGAFWQDGAVLVAHQNLATTLRNGTTNSLTGAKTPPAPASYIPAKTYATTMNVSVKGRTVNLVHMPNAHTQGDTAVWIPDANVLATGDIVSIGARYPNIDVGDKGGINGIVSAVDAYLKRSNAKTKFVPGHGPLMTRDDVVAYRKLLVDSRAIVAKMKKAGKTEDEVVAAKPLAGDIQTRAGANDAASANYIKLIYRSL